MKVNPNKKIPDDKKKLILNIFFVNKMFFILYVIFILFVLLRSMTKYINQIKYNDLHITEMPLNYKPNMTTIYIGNSTPETHIIVASMIDNVLLSWNVVFEPNLHIAQWFCTILENENTNSLDFEIRLWRKKENHCMKLLIETYINGGDDYLFFQIHNSLVENLHKLKI